MSLRFHEISEGTRRIINPITMEKLHIIGEICDLSSTTTILDLCSGKGEMLCQWAKKYRIRGVGVDISHVFHSEAVERKKELGLTENIKFVRNDALEYLKTDNSNYDIVSCIGATWIGNGLVGTLELMKQKLKDINSTLLVGEPYWLKVPPETAYKDYKFTPDLYTSFSGTLKRFEELGLELIEMEIANTDDWDRYEAQQWKNVYDWIEENPEDIEVEKLRKWNKNNRDLYFKYGREYFNWGVFVLKQT